MKKKNLVIIVIALVVIAMLIVLIPYQGIDRMSHNKHVKQHKSIQKTDKICVDCAPPECVHQSCHNEFCQQYIRGCHAITEIELLSKITMFTGGAIPAPYVYSASGMQNLLNSVDCENPKKIDICGNFKVKTTNADITVGFDEPGSICKQYDTCLIKVPSCPGGKSIMDKKMIALYSKALFQGIMQLEPSEFHFYKAISYKNCNINCDKCLKHDIVFLAVSANGEVVYVGDVSDLFP